MLALADIGSRIGLARKEQRLSQMELARKAGVSRSTIDLLENARAREIGYSRLARILAAAGLELKLQPIAPQRPTLDDLLAESDDD
jgi:transcriptional regulator with XRE-family HTH domain